MNFEDSLTSINKITKSLLTQTSTKPRETYDFNQKKNRKDIYFQHTFRIRMRSVERVNKLKRIQKLFQYTN